MSEVGSGQVAIFPTFRGFRRAVTQETGGAATEAASGFNRTFTRAGSDSGRGFSRAFASNASGASSDVTAQLTKDVAKASKAVSEARLKEQDAAGRVRVAEEALAFARARNAAALSAAQARESSAAGAVAQAEANLADAVRRGGQVTQESITASQRLAAARTALATAQTRVGSVATTAAAQEERLATAQRGLATAQGNTSRSSESLRTAQARLAAGGDVVVEANTRTRRSADQARQGFDDLGTSGERSVGGLKETLKGLGPLIAGAFAVDKIKDFFSSAVQGASDLQQNVGGIEAVMKGGAKAFLDYSKTASTSVGISASEYDRLGTLIGSQLKNGGVATDQLAGKTSDLIKTGADLSAMFGGSAADAVDALSSALKGERDPIERYGVSLNQAKIDAEAASLGFKKVGGSLSTEANQAATLSLIMKQTADAHGAFGRENDTLAHKQQVLNAQWEDGKARLGTAFLPAVTAVTGALSAGLGPALDIAEKGINGVIKGVGFVKGILVDGDFKGGFFGIEEDSPIVDMLFTIRDTVKSVVSSTSKAFAPFLAPIKDAIGGLLPTFLQLAGAVSPFQIVLKGLEPVLPQIAGLVGQLAATLASTLAAVLPQIVPLIVNLSQTISGVLATAIPLLLPVIGQLGSILATLIPVVAGVLAQVLPLVTTLISQLAPIFVQLITTILPPVIEIFTAIASAVAPLISTLADLLIPVIQALLPVITTVFQAIVPIIQSALQIVLGVVKVVTGLLTGNWKQVFGGLKDIVSGAFSLVVSVVKGALSILGSAVSAGLKVVTGLFTGLGGKILKSLGDLGGLLLDVGTNIVEGLKKGISDGWSGLLSSVSGLVNKLPAVVKKILGIHSPSRVMATLGRFVTQGFAQGILGSQKQVSSAMQSLANKVTDAMTASDVKNRLAKAAGQSILDTIGKQSGVLQNLATQREKVVTRLKAATKDAVTLLKEQADYAKKIAQAAVARADVTASTTSADMIQNLKDQVTQTKQFQTVLIKLRKLGLDKTTYQQFLAKGVDGLGSAQGLLAGGKAAVKSVGSLQKQLGGAAKSLGTAAANSLYGAGVNAAKGLVAGLVAQKGAIQKQMNTIAASMVSSIKSALGIHSPSTVFRDKVGQFIPAGVVAGIDKGQSAVDQRVRSLVSVPTGLSAAAARTGAAIATTASSSSSGSPVASKSDRPVYMDGTLFGIIRELANGEAQLLINQDNARRLSGLRTGKQRGR